MIDTLRPNQWQRKLVVDALDAAPSDSHRHAWLQNRFLLEKHIRISADDLRLTAQALLDSRDAVRCQLNSTPMPTRASAVLQKQIKRIESLRYYLLYRTARLEYRAIS